MKILFVPILFAAALLAQDAAPPAPKPPVIPDAVQARFRAAQLKSQKAQTALELAQAKAALIAAQEDEMVAVQAVQAACGDAHQPTLNGGMLSCVPKPPETAAAKPRPQSKKEKP
mgnify:CR=1 FL=1